MSPASRSFQRLPEPRLQGAFAQLPGHPLVTFLLVQIVLSGVQRAPHHITGHWFLVQASEGGSATLSAFTFQQKGQGLGDLWKSHGESSR